MYLCWAFASHRSCLAAFVFCRIRSSAARVAEAGCCRCDSMGCSHAEFRSRCLGRLPIVGNNNDAVAINIIVTTLIVTIVIIMVMAILVSMVNLIIVIIIVILARTIVILIMRLRPRPPQKQTKQTNVPGTSSPRRLRDVGAKAPNVRDLRELSPWRYHITLDYILYTL